MSGESGNLAASSNITSVEMLGTTTRICAISRVRVGQRTHKTSEQYDLHVRRLSATGTGTAYTPMLKEPNAGAVGFPAKITMTIEGTYTGTTTNPDPTGDIVTSRWNSLTGKDIAYPMGAEQYVAPSASAGLGFENFTPSGTTTFVANVEVEGVEIG
jgi:hypothetical protein